MKDNFEAKDVWIFIESLQKVTFCTAFYFSQSRVFQGRILEFAPWRNDWQTHPAGIYAAAKTAHALICYSLHKRAFSRTAFQDTETILVKVKKILIKFTLALLIWKKFFVLAKILLAYHMIFPEEFITKLIF